jgi:hypothetical protein
MTHINAVTKIPLQEFIRVGYGTLSVGNAHKRKKQNSQVIHHPSAAVRRVRPSLRDGGRGVVKTAQGEEKKEATCVAREKRR